jgi:hypothetical protein
MLILNVQLLPDQLEEENARMTTEQLKELSEALSICSAKSSVIKERDELRALMEENLLAEEAIIPLLLLDFQVLILSFPMTTGSKITVWSSNEAYPFHAH